MKRATTLLAIVITAGLVLLTGCSSNSSQPGPAVSPVPAAASSAQPIAATQQSNAAPIDGYSVTVPKLSVDKAPLVPLGLNADHTIQVPPLADPKELGVYDKGPLPGANGPAILLGHVNASGVDGAFARLSSLKPGDTITTTAPGSVTTRFSVYKTQVVPKDRFPTSSVYSDTPGPELRLITCGGDLDRTAHNYLSQVIVWAKKAD